jgi:hypothetical protein
MAIRVAGNPPVMPEMVEEEPLMEEPTPDMAMLPEEPTMGGMVDPFVAKYMGPEAVCGSCVYFLEGPEAGSCEIVSGPIDAAGRCSLWTPDMDSSMPTDEMELPVDDDAEMLEEPLEG